MFCGDDRADSGQIFLDGKERQFSGPSDALEEGILSVPKDRREEGIIGTLSVAENISLSSMKAITRHRVLSGRERTNRAQDWIRKLNIKASGPKVSVNTLSGGNAQKVVFARVISGKNKVVILNHPTRGVDVGAKEEIYQLIREITGTGIGVVLLGDTLDETISLSSRATRDEGWAHCGGDGIVEGQQAVASRCRALHDVMGLRIDNMMKKNTTARLWSTISRGCFSSRSLPCSRASIRALSARSAWPTYSRPPPRSSACRWGPLRHRDRVDRPLGGSHRLRVCVIYGTTFPVLGNWSILAAVLSVSWREASTVSCSPG